ncbi:MAG: hypothetical protein ACYC6P_05575 [Ignavibacteriaceae bacterium]
MKRYKIIVLFMIMFSVLHFKNLHAQDFVKVNLTGNLNFDSNIQLSSYHQIVFASIENETQGKKSIALAGVLSGILPGAGEFYAGRYLKAGIFFTVEAAAIATALIYTRKGDNQTNYFQDYANQHWSAVRYATWTINNSKYINPNVDPKNYNVLVTNSSGTVIGVNWSELNRLESDIGGGYSHNLAPFGTQDYYEIIGKYPQFSHGWDTSNPNDTDFHILTQQFLLYAHARGLANSLYTTGNTAIIALFVNHFLSIFDAIWSASTNNKLIAVNLRVQDVNMANKTELIPTLNLSYNF